MKGGVSLCDTIKVEPQSCYASSDKLMSDNINDIKTEDFAQQDPLHCFVSSTGSFSEHEDTEAKIEQAKEANQDILNNLFKCSMCYEQFKSQTNCTVHETHCEDNSFEISNMTDGNLSGLKTNKMQHPLKHEMCKETLKTVPTFTVHARAYAEGSFKCQSCDKTFRYLSALTVHTKSHSEERPYICDVCQKGFKQLGNLNLHKKSHLDERPYSCDICDKVFTLLHVLNSHKRTHRDERPYKCKLCQKTYRQQSGLVHHKRTHSVDRPNRCDVCGKAFKQLSILKVSNLYYNLCIL